MKPTSVYIVQTCDPESDTTYFIAAHDALQALLIWRGCEPEDPYFPDVGVMTEEAQKIYTVNLDEAEAPVCSIRVAMAAFVTEPCVIACSDW